MRLFFDARYIRTDFHDGISRYTTELANAVAAQTHVVFIISDPKQLEFLPKGAAHVTLWKPDSIKEPLASIFLQKHKPDVVFSPLQSFGTMWKRFPLILTIHDLIYYRHRTPPAQFNWFVRLAWRAFYLSYVPQRIALNAAEMVATVSDTSEDQIHAAKLTKRTTIVIPNAPRNLLTLIDSSVTVAASGPRNLVYMGSFMGYKNVETLIAGMQWLPEHTLHLLSRVGEKRRRELEAAAPAGARIVFHNGVSDEQYAELLADNAILVTASKDEGYGLPVAEALAMKVPAVISELPIFHEVAGDGALFFPAEDPRTFANNVLALDDHDTYSQVVAAGTAHISRFTWARSARQLIQAAAVLARG